MSGKAAVIGSGNIGTDLMIKMLRSAGPLEVAAMVRHRPRLRRTRPARAASASPTTADGVDGLIALPGFDEIAVVFDATSAGGARGQRARHWRRTASGSSTSPRPRSGRSSCRRSTSTQHRRRARREHGHLRRPGHDPDRRRGRVGDPGAVRRDRRVDRLPVGRARAPAPTSTSSPRPRPRAIESVGGARRGKAVIILNPAEPPLIMRDTRVLPGRRPGRGDARGRSPSRSSGWSPTWPATCPGTGSSSRSRSPQVDGGARTLVATAGDPPGHRPARGRGGRATTCPPYAGNLDIMTSAALRVGERIAARPGAVP